MCVYVFLVRFVPSSCVLCVLARFVCFFFSSTVYISKCKMAPDIKAVICLFAVSIERTEDKDGGTEYEQVCTLSVFVIFPSTVTKELLHW